LAPPDISEDLMGASRAGRSSENGLSSRAFWGGLGGLGRRSRQEIPSIAKICSTPADPRNLHDDGRRRFRRHVAAGRLDVSHALGA